MSFIRIVIRFGYSDFLGLVKNEIIFKDMIFAILVQIKCKLKARYYTYVSQRQTLYTSVYDLASGNDYFILLNFFQVLS